MFKNKIKNEKTIIIPKSNNDTHSFKNDIKINKHNKDYENIRNMVENKDEISKNSNEKQAEEIKPARKVKTVELVSCPKCKKEMTKRTLRYDHEKTCPGEPIVRESVPVKRRPVSKKENETPAQPINIPDELIEQEVKKRMQNTSQDRMQQKIKLKEDRIKKLATQIA